MNPKAEASVGKKQGAPGGPLERTDSGGQLPAVAPGARPVLAVSMCSALCP